MSNDDITDETRILGRRPKKQVLPSVDGDEMTKPTKVLPPRQSGGGILPGSEPPTTPTAPTTPAADDSEVTRIYRGPRPATPATPPGEAAPGVLPGNTPQQASFMDDPVAGFLVVIKGPGQGSHVSLGLNQNSVGRENGRIILNFGDATISREGHCTIVYDPRGREFIIRPGEKANMTYLNGSSVHQATQVKDGDVIEVGATHLRLVTLCGEDFSWDDVEA